MAFICLYFTCTMGKNPQSWTWGVLYFFKNSSKAWLSSLLPLIGNVSFSCLHCQRILNSASHCFNMQKHISDSLNSPLTAAPRLCTISWAPQPFWLHGWLRDPSNHQPSPSFNPFSPLSWLRNSSVEPIETSFKSDVFNFKAFRHAMMTAGEALMNLYLFRFLQVEIGAIYRTLPYEFEYS
jgi:hypothetical protein